MNAVNRIIILLQYITARNYVEFQSNSAHCKCKHLIIYLPGRFGPGSKIYNWRTEKSFRNLIKSTLLFLNHICKLHAYL